MGYWDEMNPVGWDITNELWVSGHWVFIINTSHQVPLLPPPAPYPPGKLLQVNTGDREVLYYEAPRGKQHFIGRDDAEELTWASWTCVLGAPCTGIWPAYTDVTDVNTACVSRDGHVIGTGDDFGFVKLFKYPSYVSVI